MFFLLFSLLFASPALAAEEPTLQDARAALVAGDSDRAQQIVEHQRAHGHEVDAVEVLVLEGLIAQARGDHPAAVWSFREALTRQPERTAPQLYLAQSLYAMGATAEALTALIAGEGPGESLPSYFILRARVETDLGQREAAWDTLDRGRARFPEEPSLRREAALLLLQLGLYRAAEGEAHAYLEARPDDRTAWLMLGDALRAAGDLDGARALLEEAALRFPEDHEVLVRLAYVWAVSNHPLVAARLYQRAHVLQPIHAFEIAEQLRAGGSYRLALSYNALVSEPDKKLPQRLALLSSLEWWDRAAALAPSLERLPALPDAARYQLAYAGYRVEDVGLVARQIRDLQDPWLREGAQELIDNLTTSGR
ncbi:MAG: tetratricopeptide repeat protein [Deltaproteobacteria bacterium]|nr:tetratricopeptide repeat protein [Deltaproteobacteria bacterium]